MEREELRQEIAMRLFLKAYDKEGWLTNAQQKEYQRLNTERGFDEAWPYFVRMAAENARRDAETFVAAYFGESG